jgi:hypothetical protein
MSTDDNNGEMAEELAGMVLPEEGVVDLTDQLTEYMTEIELGGLSDIIGQVLDDFIDQSGGMPENLRDDEAFEQITSGQLAVTLAYQLGRLEGRSPQIVERLIRQAMEKWEARPVGDAIEISEQDMRRPKELVYPRLRRMEYAEMDEDDYLDEELP